MGLMAGLDWCGKSRPTGIRSPDRPARRQSLYRLRYPANLIHFIELFNCAELWTSHIDVRSRKIFLDVSRRNFRETFLWSILKYYQFNISRYSVTRLGLE